MLCLPLVEDSLRFPLAHGNGAESKGIIVQNVGLSREGELSQVIQGFNIPWLKTHILEGILIEGNSFIDPFDRLL